MQLQVITFNKDQVPWGILSNFALTPLVVGEYRFKSLEHAYQAFKFFPAQTISAQKVIDADTPLAAKRMAKSQSELCRADWRKINLKVMEALLKVKVEQCDRFRSVLLVSGERQIVEGNARDSFWGVGRDGKGSNHLGRLLNERRAEILAGPCNSTQAHQFLCQLITGF